jgi:hypothetical protein
MILRGDRQHDIAAWFGVNGGRIGFISTGKKFPNVAAEAADKLPPPGPYLTGRDAHAAMIALEAAAEFTHAEGNSSRPQRHMMLPRFSHRTPWPSHFQATAHFSVLVYFPVE